MLRFKLRSVPTKVVFVLESEPLSKIPQTVSEWITELTKHRVWLTTVAAARLQGDRHQAEEIVADFFAQLSERPPDPQTIHHPQSWLYRSIVNRTVDWIRKRKPVRLSRMNLREQNATGDQAVDVEEVSQLPLEMLITNERQHEFKLLLHSLSPDDLEVLSLKYSHNWSYARIGLHLNLEFSAVANRLRTAKKHLKVKLLQSDFCDDFELLKDFK